MTTYNSGIIVAIKRELSLLLSELSEKRIDYCILHPFPERGYLSKSDLDLYVEKRRFREFSLFLIQHGWIKGINFRFHEIRFFYSKIVNGHKLKLDLSLEYALYEVSKYFLFTLPVRKQIGNDGYNYLDNFSGWFFVYKKWIIKRASSEEKAKDLESLAHKCSEIPALYPWVIGAEVKIYLTNQNSINTNFRQISSGRISAVNWIRAYAKRLTLAHGRTTIAFVGQDGSGKGTYLGMLAKELESRNIDFVCAYMGYASFQLSITRSIAQLKLKYNHGLMYKLLMTAYLVVLPVEFLIRRGNGAYDILLTDRHPLYEPIFNSWPFNIYDKLIVSVCPNPDLVIYLTGDSNVLWNRKKEIEQNEFTRQKIHLDSLIKSNSKYFNTIEIDTTDLLPKVFSRILNIVEKYV